MSLDKIPYDPFKIITSSSDKKTLMTLMRVSKNLYKLTDRYLIETIDEIAKDIQLSHDYLQHKDCRLFAAAWLGCLKYLVKAIAEGAEINAPLYLARRENIFITPLHNAALSGNMACIKFLSIEHKAFCENKPSIMGYTSPLHYAAAAGNTGSLAYFLNLGIPVDLPSSISCPLGWNWTPLQIAASNGHVGCVELLIQRGAHVNESDPDRYTALHRASNYGHLPCVELLLQYHANPNAMNEDGITPLLLATKNKQSSCVQRLLQAKANPQYTSRRCHRGYTPLQIAIENNDLVTAEILLKHESAFDSNKPMQRYVRKVDVQRKNNHDAPLFLAVRSKNHQAVSLLLEYNASVDIVDNDGNSLLDVARATNDQYLTTLIKRHMKKIHSSQQQFYFFRKYQPLPSDLNIEDIFQTMIIKLDQYDSKFPGTTEHFARSNTITSLQSESIKLVPPQPRAPHSGMFTSPITSGHERMITTVTDEIRCNITDIESLTSQQLCNLYRIIQCQHRQKKPIVEIIYSGLINKKITIDQVKNLTFEIEEKIITALSESGNVPITLVDVVRMLEKGVANLHTERQNLIVFGGNGHSLK